MDEKETKEIKTEKTEIKKKIIAYHINTKNNLPVEASPVTLEYSKYTKGEKGKFSKITFDNKAYGFGTNMRLNIDGQRIEVNTFSNQNGIVEIGFFEW